MAKQEAERIDKAMATAAPALALDCDSAGFVVPVQDSCWDETERSSLQRRLLARDNHEVTASWQP